VNIRIKDIKAEGLSFEFHEDWENFPALVRFGEADQCEFLTPVRIQGRAIHVGRMIEIEGRIETSAALTCSRCLNRVERPLESRFAVTFFQDAGEEPEDEEEEVELAAEDLSLIPFHGEEIDLREPVQEQVIMALPIQVLCREDCKGICPQCGADLNEEECGCSPAVFNPKFAALKKIKVEKKD